MLKSSAVWVMDENGVWIPGTIDIPEGWFALPDVVAGDEITAL